MTHMRGTGSENDRSSVSRVTKLRQQEDVERVVLKIRTVRWWCWIMIPQCFSVLAVGVS